jgi:nickel/cobalt exporter
MIAISKAEKWTHSETLWVTAFAGGAHTLSTVLIGGMVGLVGYNLSSLGEFVTGIAAPLVLVTLGVVYLILDLRKSHHRHDHLNIEAVSRKSKTTIVLSLCIAMFFSPCLEIEAFFFTAGTLGFVGVLIVSLIYTVLTVSGMVLLVHFGLQGVEKLKWHFLEHHEKRITGLVLVVLGVFTYFIRF